jgi:hypothetical protein
MPGDENGVRLMANSDDVQAMDDGKFVVTECDRVHVWQVCERDGLQNISLSEKDLLQMLAALQHPEASAVYLKAA